jgi:LysR family glycine cleavage system transcriptional activator
LLIERGLGHHPGYRCDRVNEGSGLGDWLIAPEGSADCPEVVSFREWLRTLHHEGCADLDNLRLCPKRIAPG